MGTIEPASPHLPSYILAARLHKSSLYHFIFDMDVFGTVGSAISVLEASGKIIKATRRYYSDFKKADAIVRRLAESMNDELEDLKRFKSLCDTLELEASPRSRECLNGLKKFLQDNSDGSQTLYKDLTEAVEWLKRKAETKTKTSSFVGKCHHMLGKKEDAGEERGLTFTQKAKWALKGKKKIEKLSSRLDCHRRRISEKLIEIQR